MISLLAVGGLLLVLDPPVEGYYRSKLWGYLDGNSAFVQLQGGTVYAINVGGESGPSRRCIGAYSVAGDRTVSFHFSVDALPDYTTRIGWLGFSWDPDWCAGEPGHPERNQRVVNPFRVRVLDGIR
jgi:hypothetical protein